jgi:Flp pilus assembly protein TadG
MRLCSRSGTNRVIPSGAATRSGGKRQWRGLGECQRATAAVEFVLVSGPLLFLLFGFIATNTMFYTWSSMQNNVQYAALMLATGQITSFSGTGVTCSPSLTATQVEYYACSGLPSWATFTATATETCSAPANVSVTLTANASGAALANVYSLFSGKTLTSQSVTMKQGNCP